MLAIATISTKTDGMNWYLVYDSNSRMVKETSHFQTNETENLFFLTYYSIKGKEKRNEMQYQIINSYQSSTYDCSYIAKQSAFVSGIYNLKSDNNITKVL